MKLNYQIVYSRRRTLNVSVERDKSVVVRAPEGTSEDRIRRAVEARKLWLFQKIKHKQKYPMSRQRKEFVSGETITYLGRNYRLEICDEPIPGVHFRHSSLFPGKTNGKLPASSASGICNAPRKGYPLVLSTLLRRWG